MQDAVPTLSALATSLAVALLSASQVPSRFYSPRPSDMSRPGAIGNMELDINLLMTGCYAAVEAASAPRPEPVAEPVLTPAVPVRKSINPDYIVCLEDGKRFKSLKRHLMTHYGLTPDEYRAKWGLAADYPMVAPNYAAIRSKLAKDNGLGRKAA